MYFAVESRLDELRGYPSKRIVRMPNSFIFIAKSTSPDIEYFTVQGYEGTYDGYEGTIKEWQDKGLVRRVIRVWRNINHKNIPRTYGRLRSIMDNHDSRLGGDIRKDLKVVDKLV